MDSTPRPYKELVESLLKKYASPFIHDKLRQWGYDIAQLTQETKEKFPTYSQSNLDDMRLLFKVYAESLTPKQAEAIVAPILRLLNTLSHTASTITAVDAKASHRALKDFLGDAKASKPSFSSLQSLE